LCPQDEGMLRDPTPSGTEKIPMPDELGAEIVPPVPPPVPAIAPTLDGPPRADPSMSMAIDSAINALIDPSTGPNTGPSTGPGTEPSPDDEAVYELVNPKGVPALHLADAVEGRDRHRRLAARAALLVIAVAALALVATHIGSCAARMSHS